MQEVMFSTRCVACDEPITESDRTIVAKGREYCPACNDAIWSAKRAERDKQKATRKSMLSRQKGRNSNDERRHTHLV